MAACPAGSPAPPADRGRSPDAGGADVLQAGEPVQPAPAGDLGRPRRWLIPDDAVDRPGFALPDWFGSRHPSSSRSAPASARRPLRSRRPGRRTTCWRSRLATRASPTLWESGRGGATTSASARSTRSGRWSTWWARHTGGLWTFFPDPWPKTRHHKRRLVTPEFARLAASRLAPGGWWRLATDWEDYAEQMWPSSMPSPLSKGGVVTAGTTGRSRGSSARASRRGGRSPTWPTTPLTGSGAAADQPAQSLQLDPHVPGLAGGPRQRTRPRR